MTKYPEGAISTIAELELAVKNGCKIYSAVPNGTPVILVLEKCVVDRHKFVGITCNEGVYPTGHVFHTYACYRNRPFRSVSNGYFFTNYWWAYAFILHLQKSDLDEVK